MQAINVTRHSRITTAGSIYHRTLRRLLFPVRMQKKVAHDFRYGPRTIWLNVSFIVPLFFFKLLESYPSELDPPECVMTLSGRKRVVEQGEAQDG